MKNDFYLSYLDEMTHAERSIFLYRYILKLPTTETAQRLKLPFRQVQLASEQFKTMIELSPIKKEVFEAFGVSV